jgi:hypothetical protein
VKTVRKDDGEQRAWEEHKEQRTIASYTCGSVRAVTRCVTSHIVSAFENGPSTDCDRERMSARAGNVTATACAVAAVPAAAPGVVQGDVVDARTYGSPLGLIPRIRASASAAGHMEHPSPLLAWCYSQLHQNLA